MIGVFSLSYLGVLFAVELFDVPDQSLLLVEQLSAVLALYPLLRGELVHSAHVLSVRTHMAERLLAVRAHDGLGR